MRKILNWVLPVSAFIVIAVLGFQQKLSLYQISVGLMLILIYVAIEEVQNEENTHD